MSPVKIGQSQAEVVAPRLFILYAGGVCCKPARRLRPGTSAAGPGVLGTGCRLVALMPQWRQDCPNNRSPTRATAISEMGQEPPTALQKKIGRDIRFKARHAAPTAIG